MSDLVIRKRNPNSISQIDSSPDIILNWSYSNSISQFESDYNYVSQPSANKYWLGYAYVRVKNVSSKTINSVYVTMANKKDQTAADYNDSVYRTVDGRTYAYIDSIEPGAFAVTNDPFVINFEELDRYNLYARACAGAIEYPNGDGSDAEAWNQGAIYAITEYKVEGFEPIVNFSKNERTCTITPLIEGGEDDIRIEFSQRELGVQQVILNKQTISFKVPANYNGYIHYFLYQKNFEGLDNVSLILNYSWEECKS